LVTVGARLELPLVVAARVALVPHVDLVAPLTRTSLRVSGEAVWTTPPLSGALGARLERAFW
jgi:hypothetical protein